MTSYHPNNGPRSQVNEAPRMHAAGRGQRDSRSIVAWAIGIIGLLFLGVIVWSGLDGRMHLAFSDRPMISQAPTTGYGIDQAVTRGPVPPR